MEANYTPFHQRFEEIKTKTKPEGLARVWRNALIFSLVVLIFTFLYNWLQLDRLSLRTWNKSFADTGMLLIGLSFALSGICYFWNFADTKIMYRKDLGLNGFYLLLTHSVYAMFFSRFTKWHQYFNESNLLSTTFALGSLAIFAIMALSSNKFAIHELGGKNWRRLLRTGYIAFIFGLAHMGLMTYDTWLEWIQKLGLPPFSLFVFVFGVLVVLLRIVLFFALLRNKEGKN
jgi:DMSO/TMAO reductase YedYZ heme-binding membrane subunit